MPDALRTLPHAALAAALLLAPRVALACAVCTGGQKEEVGRAFFVGSVLLSVLPLAAIGAAVWWLRRRARALDAPRAMAALPSPRS